MKYGESYPENVDLLEYLGFKLKYNAAVLHLIADRAFKARTVTHVSVQATSTNDNKSGLNAEYPRLPRSVCSTK